MRTVHRLLDRYLDGRLEDEIREEYEHHLESCSRCRRSLPPVPGADRLRASIIAASNETTPQPLAVPRPRPRLLGEMTPAGVVVAAAVVTLMLLGPLAFLGRPDQSTEPLTSPTPQSQSDSDLVLHVTAGQGDTSQVQELVSSFASTDNFVDGSAHELGVVEAPRGPIHLVRWQILVDGEPANCVGAIRSPAVTSIDEFHGIEACPLIAHQDPTTEIQVASTEGPLDQPPQSRWYTTLITGVPPEIDQLIIQTAGMSVTTVPVEGIAFAEWQGHGPAGCTIGIRADQTTTTLHC